MLKKLLFILFIPMLFMGATTIDDNLTITMDDIQYHNTDLGVEATFTYSGTNSQNQHIWTLTSLTEKKQGSYSEWDIELGNLINEYRKSLGLKELIMTEVIWIECLEHNVNMAEGKVPFGHDGFQDRIYDIMKYMPVGYAVENCGMGYSSPQNQFRGWLNSPAHKANMEYPGLTHMGVSFYDIYCTFLAIQSR